MVFSDPLMRAQKEAYDRIMTRFNEDGKRSSSSRVSILVSTQLAPGETEVETICYVVQGVLRPFTDITPYHNHFTKSLGVVTLRCINSSILENKLYDWNTHQCRQLRNVRSTHIYGVLNLEADTIEAQKPAHPVTLAMGTAGHCTLEIRVAHDSDQTVYKYVDSHEVRSFTCTLTSRMALSSPCSQFSC